MMTRLETVCSERMARWAAQLIEDGATPYMLIGVVHDRQQAVLIADDRSPAELVTILRCVLERAEAELRGSN